MSANVKLGSFGAAKRKSRVGRVLLVLLAVLVIGGGAAWYLMGKKAQAAAAASPGTPSGRG